MLSNTRNFLPISLFESRNITKITSFVNQLGVAA